MIEVLLSEMKQENIVLSEASAFNIEITAEIVPSGEYEKYTGSCTVIPSSSEQTLHTAGKYVGSDITVRKMPYAEVINEAGGSTVIIG